MALSRNVSAKLCFAFCFFLIISSSVKAQTSLTAGDIAFTGYKGHGASATVDEFSFVLLANITSGTVIHFTENAWTTDNVFRTGENTVTWTSNSALSAGQEIRISGTTATLASGPGSPGTVTGTALALSANGDQIIAYQSTTVGVPPFTFITAIHMNVYNGAPDPSITTAAAWDALNVANSTANSCAIPTGLTTGVNAIWIGVQGDLTSEKDNAYFVCAGDLSTVASIKALIFDRTKWATSDNDPPGFSLPTGCSYVTAVPAPVFTLQPANTNVCEGANTSFTITATGATSYQWQVDQGGGFVNITNDATYSGATTTTLNVTAVTNAMNGFLYRCIATNGSGSTNSNNATLTVTPLPINPTLLAKTPATPTVADGVPVSATFNAGSGGTGCADDYRYTINGGTTYLPYTPGSNISTTGLAAAGGMVVIEGRRAGCSSLCQNSYVALASWVVTPLPAGATTLAAGDIGFSAYTAVDDQFSFVLLKNIGPGTVINFTENGWLSTNVFRTGENTVTWTSNAAYQAGTEININGLTATLAAGGSAGTVTGTALALAVNGDQIIAYQGSAASPTFISAIHMNVYDVANGDPVTTTAAAWDGTANTTNASALPTGLTTGVNAIWIGTQNDINSEFDNARFGNCSHPAVFGPINTLRAALNNQANWIRNNSTPPGFNVPTGCNYLNSLVPTITTTASFTPFVACTGTPSAEQTFTVSGTALTANIVVTAPTNFRVSLTSGAGYGTSVSLTPSGGTVNSTTIYIRTAGTALPGSLSGNVTCASAGATTITIPVSGTVYAIPNTYNVTGGGAACGVTGVPVGLSGSDLDVTYQLQINGVNTGSPVAGTGSPISFGSQTAAGTYTVIANQGTSCQQTMTGSAIVTIGPVMNAPTVTQPTHAVPTGTIVVNATAGPGQTLEYKIGSGAYQVSNTFSGLAPGLYNIFARVQGTNCESPYINNPVSIWAIGTRVSDNCLIYGTSPFQDSMWSVRISDYAIIDRLAPSLPGFTITGITGMATDPITAEVYVIMKLSGVSGRVLGKINLQTGVCTQVGNLGDNFASITFRSDGQLFGVTGNGAMVPETLYLIDKTNGNKTLAATLGAGADGEIICFNPEDNFIYHWSGNGTVVYEKVMSISPYTTTNIPITGTTNGETFGAIYLGGGEFLTSNIASSFNKFTTTGTVTGPFGANPDDLRGLVRSGSVSSITAGGPTSICQVGGSVLLTVNGGTGSYQWYRNGITIAGENNATYTASTAGVYNCRYADVCGTIDSVAAGIIVSTLPDNTITLTSAAGTNNQTVLINTPITTITYATTGATGATFSGLPAGVTGIWNANTVTISGTPTVPGLFNYTVALTGGCGTVQATGSIDVIVCSITLTSAPGTIAQTVCQNTAITNITYATTGATGATVSGLPPGVTGTWAANVVTISGAPTAAGPFNYTVTPTGGGCNGSITATGTINVIPAPVITCPVNTTVAACQTQASVNAQFAAWLATASGSGGSNGVLTNNNTGAPSACGGSTTVTFTYTNDCAPTTITCQATFTVTAPPTVVLSCPVNTTVAACQTQAAVNAQFAAWLATASASGGCNGVLTNNNTGAPSACGGSTTVTFTYTSSCAPLTTTCTATFTVAAPPTVVLTCPVNTTVSSCQTQAAVNAQFAAWLATASATGGCNGVLTNNNTGAPPACGGSTTVTFTYTSSCAPTTTTCTATFTVPAPPPVIITCPAPVTVSCVAEVPAPDVTTVTVNNGCGVVVTHQGDVISGQTCVNRYTITRTYRATDVCGNFTECTQVITVNDQTPPVITCPAPVTVSCASAVPAPNTASVIATDNCGGVVTVIHVSDVISNQTCANRFTITRTYRATDVCGNFAECTQIITVNDQTPPTLTCPAPVTVSCASAVPAPNIALVTGVSDNCGGVVTVTHVSDVISNQTCANRYTITRTYRATDVCGNFAECTQIITVNDQTPPVITCPAPITVSCASAVPAPNIALVTATDNCAGTVTITHISDVISNQTCPNRFTLTRRYRATDVCGNFAECTQIITVNDQTAPVITCPSNITVTTPFGSCTAVVNFTVTATDNCGTVNIVSVPASGSAFPIGTTTVTSTATDACGNTATCTFTITVLDGQLPVITAQPQNRTVCAGQNATFSVTAITSPNANGPLNYQWQSWNGSAWVNVSGATSSTFTVSNTTVSQNTNSYRVQVIGLCTTVTSTHATLYVNPNPTVTIQTSRPPAILPTQTVNLIAVVTPGGGTYQWFKNNVAIPGSTGSGNALLNLTVDDAGTYRVRYTDPNGCVSTSADVVVSALASPGLWVFPNPNQGTFNVRYYNQTGEKTTVKVYNLLGQEVYSQSLPLGISYSTITVNLYRQPAGTYIVKVLNGNNVEIASRRIIVYHP